MGEATRRLTMAAKTNTKGAKRPAKKAAASGGAGIIDPKYREAMKDREPDWVRKHIAKHAAEGKMLELAQANGVLPAVISRLKSMNPGQVSMTLANILRGFASARHGLHGTDGKFYKADPAWLKDRGAPDQPTHSKDGEKIVRKKDVSESAAA
jgi:hypothetical protein